ncbi:MAG TPA: hypothetical protein EYP10_01680, partial [Armatimonadetes bacterium]|nr:hypothetical protein [Armatimonadota bacterium]
MSYGASVPMSALPNIKRFLAEGGGLVSPAGAPLSHPMVRRKGGWEDLSADFEEPVVRKVFLHMLPFAKVYKGRKPTRFCIVLRRDMLPNLPPMWELDGDSLGFIPITDGSQHLTVPLIAALSEDGDVLTLPLVFTYRLARYPCARIVALGFSGAGHPWSRRTWDYASTAIADMVSLAIRRNYIAIRDLMTDQPCYLPDEEVAITAELVCPVSVDAQCQLFIRERDTGRIVHKATKLVKLKAGERTQVQFHWRIPIQSHWAYDIWMNAITSDSPMVSERTMLIVRTERIAQRAKSFAMSNDGIPLHDGKPTWLSGFNLYTNDSRGIGAYFDSERRLGKHPLPDLWDRNLSLLTLYGGNAIRQHYYERILNERVFSRGNYSWALRVLDANHLLIAYHDAIALTNPFTFTPACYWRKRLGDGDPYCDERWLRAEREYVKGLAQHLRIYPNIAWEIINEPEGYGRTVQDATERREYAERVTKWCGMMRVAIESGERKPVGIGLAFASLSPLWSIRHNLRFLDWSNVHCYSPKPLRRGLWALPFGLNYGRPCLIGEAGMPNATNSINVFLSEWGDSYDRMLHVALSERAMGFVNFYLNNPLQHPYS